MTVSEPVTMLTDYALAGVNGWLGWQLLRLPERPVSRALWAVALVMLGLGALLGGTYHGFAAVLEENTLGVLWKTTVFAIGIAAFCMFSGSIYATTQGRARRMLLGGAGMQLALYSVWMLGHDAFLFVIADTAAAMVGVAALHAGPALRSGDRASRWILAAVGVSALAAAVQAAGLSVGRHLNHNDLYHLVQIAATVLFYKGVALLRDRAPFS